MEILYEIENTKNKNWKCSSRLKYVSAAIKQILNNKENPKSAPMQIQYQ